MPQPIVLDLETQHTFREKGNDPKELKISVVGIYDYATQKYESFKENELKHLFQRLEKASSVIGFNSDHFDLQVLAPYYVGDISKFHSTDLLKHVYNNIGRRVSLDDLAKETLGEKKTAHGLKAIEYFRNNEWEKLVDYCLYDVKITKDLYDYGVDQRVVFFRTPAGKQVVPVSWEVRNRGSDVSVNLTMPW